MITILLADDHDMVRAGLRSVLERQPDMTVVAEACDGAAAVETALRLEPTVAVIDVGLPGMDGLDALERIKAHAPQIRVLMISGQENEQYLLRAAHGGASGYLLKQGSAADLVQAVRSVAKGELVFTWAGMTGLMEECLRGGRREAQLPRHSTLTERERDVLRLVAQGYSNTEIATRLMISPKTVDTHRTRLMSKLDLHTRAALVLYALRHGYLVATA